MFGIPVRIHWSLLVVLGLLVMSAMMGSGGNPGVLAIQLMLFGGLLATVIIHEFGHALVARRLGADVIDVVLWPLVAYARYRRLPDDSYRELLVAAAGPAANLVVAAVIMLWAGPDVVLKVITHSLAMITEESETASAGLVVGSLDQVVILIGAMNLLLAGFNLIPGFPMDGGRILRAALTPKLGYLNATIAAARVGRVIAIVFLVYGAFLLVEYGAMLGVFLSVIGFYLVMMIAAEQLQVQRRAALERYTARDGIEPGVPQIGPGTGITEALQILQSRQLRGAPVVDASGYMVGWVGLAPLMAAGLSWPGDTAVATIATRHAWVRPEDRLSRVFRAMMEYQVHPVPVVEADGRYVGLITLSRLSQLLANAAREQQPGAPR